ncbi:hypothetical protein [Kitasatospora sp. NPDC085879]|uniref:hypothetical protein n=1 Tax=Kitasatospora sp. NPDC085879 TaxID=3154769 RepID=UPI0011871B23|nr:hypothetical protein [Streptomyces sp. TLI_235]
MATLYEVIDALPVADEGRTGYVRTAFRHWIDADKNGCDTTPAGPAPLHHEPRPAPGGRRQGHRPASSEGARLIAACSFVLWVPDRSGLNDGAVS